MSLFNNNPKKSHAIPVKKYAANEVVIRQGDRADCMYDIQAGSVAVYANYGTPEQRQVAVLRKGEYFGEMAVIESQPRNATIVTLEETALQVISSGDFYQYISENPEKIALMLQRMGKAIQTANGELFDAYETISLLEQCRAENATPDVNLASRVKVYSGRYRKGK